MVGFVQFPYISYLGQTVRLSFDATNEADLSHIVFAYQGSAWDLSLPYTTHGIVQMELANPGWIHVGGQSLDSNYTWSENIYGGMFPIFDAAQVTDLVTAHDGRINIVDIDSNVSRTAAQTDWRAGIESWTELAEYVDSQFAAWTVPEGLTAEQARVFFYVQWVSGLWAYGNQSTPDLPGTVFVNEIVGTIPTAGATVQTYLTSDIGACNDYAPVLTFLLEHAGIENRAISGSGHVFNEALIDGAWWSIDANMGLAYNAPFDAVLNTANDVLVYRFDHEGMRQGSSIYRDALGQFQITLLQELEFGFFESGARREGLVLLDDMPQTFSMLAELGPTRWAGTGGTWSGGDLSRYGWTVGDFNGDGATDLANPSYNKQDSNVRSLVRLSNGAGFDSATQWSANLVAGTDGWLVGDYDGDGNDDLLTYSSEAYGGTAVALSTGSAFLPGAVWTTNDGGSQGWSAGDFDGDGKTDILRVVSGYSGAEVFLSTGTSFELSGSWTGGGAGSQGWYIGDFNGDGRDDLARFMSTSGTTEVLLSDGSAFVHAGTWSSSAQGGSAQWFVGDFNGDGLDDLGRDSASNGFEASAGFEYLASTGSVFAAPVLLNADIALDGRTLHIGDFSGDGSADVLSTVAFADNGAPTIFAQTEDLGSLSNDDVARVMAHTMGRLSIRTIESPVALLASASANRSVTLDDTTGLRAEMTAQYAAAVGADYMAPFAATVGKALYFAQWISGLWAPADVVHGATPVPTVSSFSSATVASAADVASVLAAVLLEEGITNRVITAGDYVINEFYAESRWWSVNAQAGVAIRGRWDQIMDSSDWDEEAYVFDIAASHLGSATFRDYAGAQQLNYLSDVGIGILYDFRRLDAADWIVKTGYAGIPGIAAMDAGWASPVSSSYPWHIGDFNGDGMTDIFAYAPGVSGALVSVSNGSSFTAGVSWTGAGSGGQGWIVGDFNGDGRDDISRLVSGVSGAQVFLSTGTSFALSGSWTCAGSASQAWYVGDFNGDGKDDIFRYYTGVSGAQVFLSNGSQFVFQGSWTGAGFGNGIGWKIGDFNGDGRDDLLRTISGAGVEVLLSTGSSFAAPVLWCAEEIAPANIRVTDIDGNGRDDILVAGLNESTDRVYLSTGSGFAASDWVIPAVDSNAIYVGDFDGSGTDDFFTYATSPATLAMYRAGIEDTADVLVGEAGASDTFVFAAGFGHDLVQSFEVAGAGADTIQLSTDLAADYTTVMAAAVQEGLNVVISFSSVDVLTLENVVLQDLTSNHFQFIT